MKEGYIKRKTSTIPFGYESSEVEGYLKPVQEQIDALNLVSEMVKDQEISLAVAVDWLEASTNRTMSRMGLKKHVDKKYGKRNERLGEESSSLLTG